MTLDRFPQASPVGIPQPLRSCVDAPERGNAAHGLRSDGKRLSRRFGSTSAAPSRDHVLDAIIRAGGDGPSLQVGPTAREASTISCNAGQPARSERHEGQHGARKSKRSNVARLACGIGRQRRHGEPSSPRVGANAARTNVQQGPETTSRGLDRSETGQRGSSWRPFETAGGAPPRDFY